MSVKSYQINGKVYELRPLVFGQWQQLNQLMADTKIPDRVTAHGLIGAFADRLDRMVAVILTEQGKSPRDKNIDELGEYLAFVMTPEQIAEVVTDFFEVTPTAAVLSLVAGVVRKIHEKVMLAGSSEPSSCSATETGQNATQSTGDVLQ